MAVPLINKHRGLLKRGTPLLNARGGQLVPGPLVAPRFFEVGRRPETSLVDSWQPAPPEEPRVLVSQNFSPIRGRIVRVYLNKRLMTIINGIKSRGHPYVHTCPVKSDLRGVDVRRVSDDVQNMPGYGI